MKENNKNTKIENLQSGDPCRIRHYVESMQMLCHRVCKTYANVSYIAFTRSYVVSMPGLCFLYKKCYVFASQTEPT